MQPGPAWNAMQGSPLAVLRGRLIAGAAHLAVSILIAAASAALVFLVWFPGDLREIAGGRELFVLMTAVDVVLGPLLTVVVFDRRKPRRELSRDISIIAFLQLAALVYGLHVASQARPIGIVFEVDRFRLVAANEVLVRELPAAQTPFRALPWTGPWLLGTRAATRDEMMAAVDLALQGFDIAQRPSFWQAYDLSQAAARRKARPVAQLLAHYAPANDALQRRINQTGLSAGELAYLPITSRTASWVALLRDDGSVVGYAPYDGFF